VEHREVENDAVVDRYVTGRLPAGERAAFEEHMVDCPECVQEVAWAEDFRGSLRRAEGAMAEPPAAPAALRAPRAWLLAAAGLAGAALPTVLLVAARQERARSSAEAAEWQRRYELERAERAAAAPRGDANLPTVMLSASRGGEGGGGALLTLPSGGRWAVILAELEPEAAYVSYRARIESAGRVRWSADDVRIAPSGLVSILVPSAELARGEHVLLVDGITREGRPVRAGRYVFRVAESPTR
jgi:hypothetical protein